VVGKALSKETVYDLGLAIGSEASEAGVKTIVVARDSRASSTDLLDGLTKGLASTGCKVLDLGKVPTPMLYFVAHHIEGRSGVMLTGGHNRPEYNGLKVLINGETWCGEKLQLLKQRIEEDDFVTATMGEIEHNNAYTEEYIGTICEDVRISRPLKVVIDCSNGVAGELAPALFKELGCEVIPLFCEVKETLRHHFEPTHPDNFKELSATVCEQGADIGIALDGDGDRLGVVDNKGKIIWADRQMMLYAKQVLSIKPGSEVIYDVKCSRLLPAFIKKCGGRPVMWKTGHSFMKAKIKESVAILAGEMSGHIFFNDRWFGFDDALYSAARLLEILANDARSSSEVFADLPDSINTPELLIRLEEGQNTTFMTELIAKATFPEATLVMLDGLRVEFPDGWGLVRASNTTPYLMMRFEADTQEALQKIQQQFKVVMLKIKPDIVLPF